MIFSYVRHRVDPSSAIPSGEVARPEVPIRVIGPAGSVELSGLIDTGADHIFFPVLLADMLGIELTNVRGETAEGAGGHQLKLWPAEVEIEISGDGRTYRWRAHVGFIEGSDDSAAAYLGHAGFLEYFTATFDSSQLTVELNAHDDFARSA
jgi:predicted aspartyl protease